MTLIVEQLNVMQVFEFQETPEPMIIMIYYHQENIVNAGIVDEDRYVSALRQIFNSLSHLHAKGVVHRDLKPENFLVETNPFKVVITDFGLAKVATNTNLLATFCGTLKYAAPEVFPGLSDGHRPPADIWSLGVIVFEWIYGALEPPNIPELKKEESVSPKQYYRWIKTWSTQLLDKLEDQDKDHIVRILICMLEIKVRKRWPVKKCLAQGFKVGLFKRRVVDGLIVCASDPDNLKLPAEEGDNRASTPKPPSSRETCGAAEDQRTKAFSRPTAQ